MDDLHVVPAASLTIYQPVRQIGLAGRLFVHAGGDPHALVPAITRVIREISPDQPVERAAPRHLLTRVLSEGVLIAAIGIAAGAVGGYVLARVAAGFFATVQMPGALPVIGAAAVLIGAAIIASLMPAARASRVDVLQALRSE